MTFITQFRHYAIIFSVKSTYGTQKAGSSLLIPALLCWRISKPKPTVHCLSSMTLNGISQPKIKKVLSAFRPLTLMLYNVQLIFVHWKSIGSNFRIYFLCVFLKMYIIMYDVTFAVKTFCQAIMNVLCVVSMHSKRWFNMIESIKSNFQADMAC